MLTGNEARDVDGASLFFLFSNVHQSALFYPVLFELFVITCNQNR